MMLKAKLVVVGGDANQTEVELNLPTIIGRGRDIGLTVPHELVSRRHAEIIERQGRLFVRDLGSTNGTFVNNKRIGTEHPLDPDQLLTVGTITFRAIYEIGVARTDESSAFDRETARLAEPEAETDDPATDRNKSVDSDSVGTIPIPSPQETVPLDSLSVTNNESASRSRQRNEPPARRQSGEPSSVGKEVDVVSSRQSTLGFDLRGEQHPENVAADESVLGSFLRKLPR